MTTCNSADANRLLCAWQLAILRYAVTHEATDRAHVMVLAQEVDQCCDGSTQSHGFCFFRRASHELCQAIAQRASSAALDRFIAELDNCRLKRAFLAALDQAPAAAPRVRRVSDNLFRGLPSRSTAP